MKDFNLNLLENGLDFILSSIDNVLSDERGIELKYSILHIAAGVQLVFKEKLRQEHWSLLFENTSSARIDLLETGDFISVNSKTCLSRLENICSIEISEKDKDYLNKLKNRRNKIEHFKFVDKDVSIISLVTKILIFIVDFIENHLDHSSFTKYNTKQLEALKNKSFDFDEYVKIKLAKAKSKLKTVDDKYIYKCPKCCCETMVVEGGIKCVFCEYEDSPENVAGEYLENILGVSAYREISTGGEFPLYECPECEERALVLHEDFNFCFNCESNYDDVNMDRCATCGTIKLETEIYHGMCGNCRDIKWSEHEKD